MGGGSSSLADSSTSRFNSFMKLAFFGVIVRSMTPLVRVIFASLSAGILGGSPSFDRASANLLMITTIVLVFTSLPVIRSIVGLILVASAW